MPDLSSIRRYERDLLRLERRYFEAAGSALEAARLDLQDALLVAGLKSATLTATFEGRLRSLRSELARLNREHSPEIVEVAARLAGSQLEMARSVDSRVPVSGELRSDAAEREILATWEMGFPEWEAAARARLTAELFRLRREGAETGSAAGRLFAAGIGAASGNRASAWRHAQNQFDQTAQLSLWGAGNGLTDTWYANGEARTGEAWGRQAIAAIDERTTDCCLRVHGQVRSFGEPFRLTGTPRFADEVINPPFHWFCRTSTALYLPAFEEIGKTTKEMRAAARGELQARDKTGERQEIHPAHATSRR